MTFALTPSQPIVDSSSQITAATFNYWRAAIAQAIDGAGGSNGTPYTPSTQIGIGGAGLRLYGATALELDGTSVCAQDQNGVFNWGGVQNILSNGTLNLYGHIEVQGPTGIVEFLSNTLLEIDSGASAHVAGTVSVWGGTGILNIGDSGSGGAGYLNVNKDSTLTVNGASGHLATVAFGQWSTMTMASGSTAAFGGANTQTGPWTKTGASAVSGLRVVLNPFAVDSNQTFDPSAYDVIELILSTGLTANRTWRMRQPTSGIPCRVSFSAIGAMAATNTFTIVDDNTGNVIAEYISGASATIYGFEMYYSASQGQWLVIDWDRT